MIEPRPLEVPRGSGGAWSAWRGLADLWRRVYVLCLMLYAPAGLGILAWMLWQGVGAMSVAAWAVLMIPVGFGVAFLASFPLTLVWSAAAWAAGWRPPSETSVHVSMHCPGCGYDLARTGGDHCPECGMERDPDEEREAGAG